MGRSRLFAIAYDIPSDNRRVRTANVLKSYGERVQYSVFECFLDSKELRELKERLLRVIDEGEDSVRIYPIGTPVDILGIGEQRQDEDLILV